MTKRPLLLLLIAALAAPAEGKRIYQYRDANGVLHFTDQKPADAEGLDVTETKVRADPQKIAELFMNEAGGEHVVTMMNRVAGPVSVEVNYTEATNVKATVPLPIRTSLLGFEQRELTRISAAAPGNAGFGLSYRAVPGALSELEASDYAYRFPFADRARSALGQGFNGSFSHTDAQSRFAVDIGVDAGTPVLAARGGVVMMVERDFEGSGLNRDKYADRANSVRVLHDDGSMAVYAHLEFESVAVSPGTRVNPGQMLGRAGSTGFSTGPHLHFAIQVNRGMELISIPFDFQGGMPPLAVGAPGPAR